jgi:hypothetical protein
MLDQQPCLWVRLSSMPCKCGGDENALKSKRTNQRLSGMNIFPDISGFGLQLLREVTGQR